MVNKIIFAVLFFPVICSAQEKPTDVQLSGPGVNFNTSIDGNMSLFGTYSIAEGNKVLLGADYFAAGNYYNFAPSAGIMLMTAEDATAAYLKVQAGPNFSFAKGTSPGLFFSSALGLQYLLTSSLGLNLELNYRSVNYSRDKILLAEFYDYTQGTSYRYSPEEFSNKELSLGFGINYRFGSTEKKYTNDFYTSDSDKEKNKQKNFFNRVNIHARIGLNAALYTYETDLYPGYNVFGTYALYDNFHIGAGIEYTKESLRKYYSPYLTGILQTASEKLPFFTRFSIGTNFFDDKNLSNGFMFSLAAGVKYNLSSRLGLIFETSLKNMDARYKGPLYSGFEGGPDIIEYDRLNTASRILGFSTGVSIQL